MISPLPFRITNVCFADSTEGNMSSSIQLGLVSPKGKFQNPFFLVPNQIIVVSALVKT